MAQEFTIKSEDIENKINQLLPSQGGYQPGVDISASTMVVPIVDLTETAEGSLLRQDLQTSMSLNSITAFAVTGNVTTTLVNTTGYFRVYGVVTNAVNDFCRFQLTDGTTTKIIADYNTVSSGVVQTTPFDFVVFLQAGDSLVARTANSSMQMFGNTRQIADLQGNLVNPL